MKKLEGVRYYLDMSSFTQEQNIVRQLKTRLQVFSSQAKSQNATLHPRFLDPAH
jgi:hypothetical protein